MEWLVPATTLYGVAPTEALVVASATHQVPARACFAVGKRVSSCYAVPGRTEESGGDDRGGWLVVVLAVASSCGGTRVNTGDIASCVLRGAITDHRLSIPTQSLWASLLFCLPRLGLGGVEG